jgi:CHAT domain-containing protein/Tfp pilus assembly protein PilF
VSSHTEQSIQSFPKARPAAWTRILPFALFITSSLVLNAISITGSGIGGNALAATEFPGIEGRAQNENIPALETGTQEERELAAGEFHRFRISLYSGQYVHVIVEQQGINLTLIINDPSGKPLAEQVGPYGRQGHLTISAIAQTDGSYTLEVRATEKSAPAGRYIARIDALRTPTQADSSRVAAEQTLEAGRKLRLQSTQESLRNTITKLNEALPYWRDAKDPLGEATTLNNIGIAYKNLGDMNQAAYHYEKALSLLEAAGDDRGTGYTLNYLGLAYWYIGQLNKALGCYQKALPLWQRQGDRLNEAETYNRMGGAYDGLGDIQKALEVYQTALQIREEVKDRGGQAESFNNIGVLYDKLGESQKALEQYGYALSIFEELKNFSKAAKTLNNIGFAYADLGDSEKALEYYERARLTRKGIHEPLEEATTLSNIGNVYALYGDFQKALDYYGQAIAIQKEARATWGESYTLINIGQAHASLHDSQKALECYERALGLLEEAEDRQGVAIAHDKIGQVLILSGEYQQASQHYARAIQLWRLLGDRRGEVSTLYGLAQIDFKQGNTDKALERINEAIEIIESLRIKVTNPDLRASYLASVHNIYDLAIDILMKLHERSPDKGYAAAALQTSERSRARSLIEMLTEAKADIRKGVSAALLAREAMARQQVNARAERKMALLSGKYTEAQKTDVENELAAALGQYQSIQTQIRSSSPKYAAITQPKPLGLKEIQNLLLDPDTLLLEYALSDDHSYLWAVTQDSMQSFELSDRAGIERSARRVYESLTAPNQVIKGEREQQTLLRLARAEAEFSEAATELSQLLLSPVSSLLTKKKLVIIADGVLQYVPFAALPIPQAGHQTSESEKQISAGQTKKGLNSNYEPLIVNNEIISLPSISTLAVLRSEIIGRKPAPRSVAVFADPVFTKDDARLKLVGGNRPPDNAQAVGRDLQRALRDIETSDNRMSLYRLPFSRREAEAIVSNAIQGGSKKALDFDASLEAATSPEMSQYRIIHFATHGLLDNKHPELSGIVLSLVDQQGRPRKGFLRLNEIFNLDLPAELVVLSACQTGLGKQIRGEGLIGLTRAFMYAGAARVMASLWKVDDAATAELMGRFYTRMLGHNETPTRALRYAQLEMWKQDRWRSPYYWAAFTIQGEWK